MKKRSLLSLTLCLTLLFSLMSNMLAGAAFAKESRAAIVVSVKGEVMVTKAGGSAEYRAFEEMSLSQGDHIRTQDGSSIVLQVVDQEDEVTIGPNTEMYISSLIESDEGSKKSKLKMWAGSLWFKVKKLVNADDEFELETPTAVMSVRGSNGYIESMYGQLFALMTSGVLETTPTSGDGSSGSTNISPGQQYQQSDDQSGDPSDNVTPLDIKSFVANATPEIILALLQSIQDIREENEQFVQQLGDGSKQVDSRTGLKLDTPEKQQQFGSNLTNLLANIAKEAMDSNKLPASEINELISKANENTTGERIDLNNVKPFDTSVGLDPDVQKAKQEQMQKQQESRDAAKERDKQEQQDKASQNPGLADRLASERERQEQGNNNARTEEQQRTNQTFQEQQQQTNTGNTGGNTTTPGGGSNTGTGGSTGGGNDGGIGGGGGGGGEETDTTPPSLVVAHPTVDLTVNSASQDISVYAEQNASVKLFKDGATTPIETKTGLGASTLVTFTVTLVEGANTFTVTATDAAGNATTRSVKFQLDTVSPSLTISSPANEVTVVNTKPQSIVLQAEQGALVSLFKGEAVTPVETATGLGATNITFTLNDLAEGENSYKVTATDAAGNVTARSLKYVLNTSAPSLAIKHPTKEMNVVRTKPQTIEVEVAQGITVSLYKDDSATPLDTKQGSGTSNVVFTIADLAEGTNTFKVTAQNTAGNTASLTVKYVLDTLAPALEVSHPANEVTYVNSNQQTIVVQAEEGSVVKLFKGTSAVPVETTTGKGATGITFTLNDLIEGTNMYNITATDEAGNETTKHVAYVLMTGGPSLAIVHPFSTESDKTFYTSVSTEKIRAQVAQGITVRLYKGADLNPIDTKTGNVSEPVEFMNLGLTEGLNTYRVTATDGLGNVSEKTVKYYLDTAAPALQISPSGSIQVNSKQQSIVVQAETGAAVSLYRSGSMTSPLASATGQGMATSITFTLNDLVEGINNYVVTAMDAAFNISSHPITFEVDTIAPAVPTVTAPASGPTNMKKPTFKGTAEPGCLISITLDGGTSSPITTYTNASGEWSFTSPFDFNLGNHTLTVKATDAAGNTSPASSQIGFEIVLPQVSLVVSSDSVEYGHDFQVEFRLNKFIDKTFYAIEVQLEYDNMSTIGDIVNPEEFIFDSTNSVSSSSQIGEGPYTFTYVATKYSDSADTTNLDPILSNTALFRLFMTTEGSGEATVRIKRVIIVDKAAQIVASYDNDIAGSLELIDSNKTIPIIGGGV
ncbi:Ig-like domain-containing protein [Paenibacillus mesophilus]|uniref:Ig-like domain-containing protein n=1 Tax=Paenibacillus mesophilus TaxID=2582849 RepID=UPI0013050EAD|nr:Ig-like domain-containing protein [Paenibacillus mesophilus]